MPRRLPVRPAKVFGNFFVLIVLCLMALIYYTFVFIIFGPRAESKLLFLFLLHTYFEYSSMLTIYFLNFIRGS